jgi:TRAP-type C4-dicarboxylate transport system permease small subunit
VVRRALRLVEGGVALLSKACMLLSGLLLATIFGGICYSVFMRYFLRAPQPWTEEATGWMLVAMVMLAAPEVQRRGEHIGIDFIYEKVSSRLRPWVTGLGLVFVVASAAILVREGLVMVDFTRMIGILSNQIPEVPLWAVQAFVPFGFAVLLLVAGVQLALVAVGEKPRDMAEGVQGEPT